MKKIIIATLIILSTLTTFAAIKNFTISSSNLSFENSKKQAIKKEFAKEYNLEYKITTKQEKLEDEIISLTKKVTYLLLGDMNTEEETSEEYFNRHKEYLKLRYAPEIPKIEGTDEFDKTSQEYKDDYLSGTTVPSMFLILNELDIVYSSFDNIRVAKTDVGIISSVILSNVKMKVESSENPKEYITKRTNLILYYYFKKQGNDYKLYYLIGESNDSLDKYLQNDAKKEKENEVIIDDSYESELRNIHNFSKIDNLSEDTIKSISEKNKQNIMTLTSYYNNYVVGNANAVVVNEGLVVTTWSFLEEALINAQYITITDHNNKPHQIEGIVTVNIDSDLAVIKLKEKTNSKVVIADSSKVQLEDAAILISSKTGVGLTLRKGIIVSNNGYLQNSIPVTKEEQSSPLLNSNGELIGLTSKESVNTGISLSIPSNAIKEIQDLFTKVPFEEIKTTTFKKLKESYYYVKYEEETIKNNISKNKWREYSKIGNIEKTITLDLIKASYKNKVISLRYKNKINDYVSSMQLATSFIDKLVEQGYKEVTISETKKVYQNNKCQVIIMEEFDYLIIIMVKL